MVRWLGVLLVLTLLLCGCAQEAPEVTVPTEESTVPTTESTEPTLPPGLYLPESPVEQETNGAVRSFPLDSNEYYGCRVLGEDLVLLHCKDGEGLLSLYSGERLELVRTVPLGEDVILDQDRLQITARGIGYYDPVDCAAVFLDTNLMEIGRMQLSEKMLGDAWLAPDWTTVYYCQEEGIYALDLQSGIARLLKEQHVHHQEITGLLMNGAILRCCVETEDNQKQTILVDTTSGMRVMEGVYLDALESCGDYYFLPLQTGSITQLLFGSETDTRVLWPKEEDGVVHPILERNGAVVTIPRAIPEETDAEVVGVDSLLSLTYYDIKTGSRMATVNLENIPNVWAMESDGQDGIWFLGGDEDTVTVYHWALQKSFVEDGIVYADPYYTAENPDEEGLEQLKATAAKLAEKFGVEILIWQDAAALAPADHVFTEEYLIQTYQEFLPVLETAMSTFPEGLLRQAAGEKPLKIALVQAMNGDPQWGSLKQSNNLLFWQEDEPILGLVMGEDMERNFYHGIFHLMETQVLSKSSKYYEWNTLNPKGFTYPNNYFAEFSKKTLAYAQGDKRYFIDEFSMTYAKEDRARIFDYACMPDNEEYFQSSAIQKKLRRICQGIRETFDLDGSDGPYLWEQYLKKKL